MTARERSELQVLLRQRERVLKSAAKQRSADLLANFENHLGQVYAFDQDAIWKAAAVAVKAEIDRANAAIAARCAKLGIPTRFAPEVETYWRRRGENANRRAPRRAAQNGRDEDRRRSRRAIVEIGKVTSNRKSLSRRVA